jgi:hypothetical protein
VGNTTDQHNWAQAPTAFKVLCWVTLAFGLFYMAKSYAAEGKVFQLGVSTTQHLPPPMYGTWQVTATLVQTNNPQMFPPQSQDIWTLAQDGQMVTLSNPSTGASATVNVENVTGPTATFRHVVQAGRHRQFQEMPTITVNGDTLTGVTRNQIVVSNKAPQPPTLYQAQYALSAHRIGGARVEFTPMLERTPPREFVIEPLQPMPLRPVTFQPTTKPALKTTKGWAAKN